MKTRHRTTLLATLLAHTLLMATVALAQDEVEPSFPTVESFQTWMQDSKANPFFGLKALESNPSIKSHEKAVWWQATLIERVVLAQTNYAQELSRFITMNALFVGVVEIHMALVRSKMLHEDSSEKLPPASHPKYRIWVQIGREAHQLKLLTDQLDQLARELLENPNVIAHESTQITLIDLMTTLDRMSLGEAWPPYGLLSADSINHAISFSEQTQRHLLTLSAHEELDQKTWVVRDPHTDECSGLLRRILF